MSDSEVAVIACILRDPSTLDDIAHIRDDHFSDVTNRRVFSTITDLKQHSRPIDLVTVAANSGCSLTNYEYVECDIENIRAYAKLLINEWKVREVHRLTSQVTRAIASGTSIDDAIKEHSRALANIDEVGVSNDIHLMSTVIAEEVDRVEYVFVHPEQSGRMKCGLEAWDSLTGGLSEGEVYYLLARPGVSKTALVGNSILPGVASNGNIPLFFSLEMRRHQIAGRMASALANVDQTRIRDNVLTMEHVSRLKQAAKAYAPIEMYIDDTPAQRVSDMSAKARRLDRRLKGNGKKLKVVALDYLQLVRPEDPKASENDGLTQITRDLKTLAKELEVAVVVICQMNRGNEARDNKRPTMADARGSGSIEQDGDYIVGLYREDYYKKDVKPGLTELIGLKSRGGPQFTEYAFFDGPLTQYKNLTPAQRAAFGVQ